MEDLPECLAYTVWRDYNDGNLWAAFLELLIDTPIRLSSTKRAPVVSRLIPPEAEEQLERRRVYRRLKYGTRTENYQTRSRNGTGMSTTTAPSHPSSASSDISAQTNNNTSRRVTRSMVRQNTNLTMNSTSSTILMTTNGTNSSTDTNRATHARNVEGSNQADTFSTHRERTAERRAELDEQDEFVNGFWESCQISKTVARI